MFRSPASSLNVNATREHKADLNMPGDGSAIPAARLFAVFGESEGLFSMHRWCIIHLSMAVTLIYMSGGKPAGEDAA